MEQVTLYYRQGSSDKIYQASIAAQGSGYVVQFAYGRRGSTLSTGTKTTAPVSYGEAKRVYDTLVTEKTRKGYTSGEDGLPYQLSSNESRQTGVHCQLLNAVEEKQIAELLNNPVYCLKEKLDGQRLLIRKKGNTVTGINRLGLTVSIPRSIESAALRFQSDFILDGEAIGDTLHVFDALEHNGEDLRPIGYWNRYQVASTLIGPAETDRIRLVGTEYKEPGKLLLFEKLKKEGREGVVFKCLDAPYTAGRPNSGGSQFKFKFYATASFVVGQVNRRRSVSLSLFDAGKLVSAGNVTIPVNHNVPCAGAVVECRYLYAFVESGAIYQPVYLGRRDDIAPDECVVSQLKYKPMVEKEAA